MAIVEEHPRRRFTAEEVLRMVETGILSDDEPLELLDGELHVMTPQDPWHATTSKRVERLLEQAAGPGFHTRAHSPIAGGEHDLPEPDVALVRGEIEAYRQRHPGAEEIVVVVEVSRTSQRYDRGKAERYARAGVQTYWLLDLPARRLELFTGPNPEGRYSEHRLLESGDTVRVPGTEVELP
ncbi:MAG TPA: Uma2 family endonuclease, partial [Thermoanaerobaculia bacterium]|nr:Uma2 family endonuclease [Thermoanaerobaculia bacterium]